MNTITVRRLAPGIATALMLFTQVSSAQIAGSCNQGSASADLDANNVRARLYNTGQLFWKGSGNVYTVPKDGAANAIFASGIWIGGLDPTGSLRFAGTAYGPFEYWPGPLGEGGTPPADCSPYDRIYRVSRADIDAYEADGTVTADMADWPFQLGAPVLDGDGIPDNYSLAGGDRPGLIGEQTAWWVMNDVGGIKGWSQTAPIGLEVQVTAYAYSTTDALDNTTFYRYRLIHKGSQPHHDTWFGVWSDPDLGNAVDDFVGSDTTLGLAFVYNGDEADEGSDGYGSAPPALGYTMLKGPLVPDPDGGTWTDPDGSEWPGMKRISMSKFVYYNNDSSPSGNPSGQTNEPYDYLRGIWRDGTPMTYGGSGYGGTEPVDFMFPGEPTTRSYWSEENTDGAGSRNTPFDRRFLVSVGPFDLDPGDIQEIEFAIVWARGASRMESVLDLKEASCVVRNMYAGNEECVYERPPFVEPGPVSLISPAQGVSGQPPDLELIWEDTPAPGSIGYDVQVAHDAEFTFVTTLSTTSPSIRPWLAPDNTYWWRVRQKVPGIAGPWSDAWTFSTGDRYAYSSITGGIDAFVAVANANGPLNPYEMAALTANYSGYPSYDGRQVPGDQQQAGDGLWVVQSEAGWEYRAFIESTIRALWRDMTPFNWEIRFMSRCYGPWSEAINAGTPYATPADGCYALNWTVGGGPILVPFELWRTFKSSPPGIGGTRMIPIVGDGGLDGFNLNCADHEISGGENDPFTDRINWYLPDNLSSGSEGYREWEQILLAGGNGSDGLGSQVFSGMVLVNWNGGDVGGCSPGRRTDDTTVFNSEMPEAGTIIHMTSAIPGPPVLSSPAWGAVLKTGPNRFFWNASSYETVSLRLQPRTGDAIDLQQAESGVEINLTQPGDYTWWAASSSASEAWSFTVVSGVGTERDPTLPTTVELEQNYPNPFNPSTVIRFGLPEAMDVSLDVFDVLGRRVIRVISGERYPAGYHQAVVHFGDLASGTYLYRLRAGSDVRHGKMVFLR